MNALATTKRLTTLSLLVSSVASLSTAQEGLVVPMPERLLQEGQVFAGKLGLARVRAEIEQRVGDDSMRLAITAVDNPTLRYVFEGSPKLIRYKPFSVKRPDGMTEIGVWHEGVVRANHHVLHRVEKSPVYHPALISRAKPPFADHAMSLGHPYAIRVELVWRSGGRNRGGHWHAQFNLDVQDAPIGTYSHAQLRPVEPDDPSVRLAKAERRDSIDARNRTVIRPGGKRAEALLRRAEGYVRTGDARVEAIGRERLRLLIERYPRTIEAARAERLLKEFGPQSDSQSVPVPRGNR